MNSDTRDGLPHVRWTYMLRIMGRNPSKVPMDRLGAYISEFAELLGAENFPTFAGIKKASTGLKARLPDSRVPHAHLRLVQARNEPLSKPGRALGRLQHMIDLDGIRQAQLIDRAQNVIYIFEGKCVQATPTPTIYQTGTVDGVVTGLVGADDTMHVYLRDYLDRDVRLVVRDEQLARQLLKHFRQGTLRVQARGVWKRVDPGWLPETSKCMVESFEVLDEIPISEVLAQFASTPGNGWSKMQDPDRYLAELRGE